MRIVAGDFTFCLHEIKVEWFPNIFYMSEKIPTEEIEGTDKPKRSTEELERLLDQALINQIENVRARVPEPLDTVRDLRTCQGRN